MKPHKKMFKNTKFMVTGNFIVCFGDDWDKCYDFCNLFEKYAKKTRGVSGFCSIINYKCQADIKFNVSTLKLAENLERILTDFILNHSENVKLVEFYREQVTIMQHRDKEWVKKLELIKKI